MVLEPITWVVMLGAIGSLWGVGGWSMYRTLSDEERKLKLIERQGTIDTYSPTALAELRTWIEENPDDPYWAEAVRRHDECVEILQENKETFYDWDEAQIADLVLISESDFGP